MQNKTVKMALNDDKVVRHVKSEIQRPSKKFSLYEVRSTGPEVEGKSQLGRYSSLRQ